MTTPHNDIQRHLMAKLERAADDVHAAGLAIVTAVLEGHAAGLTDQQLAAGLVAGALDSPTPGGSAP